MKTALLTAAVNVHLFVLWRLMNAEHTPIDGITLLLHLCAMGAFVGATCVPRH